MFGGYACGSSGGAALPGYFYPAVGAGNARTPGLLYTPGEPDSIHCSHDGFPYTIPSLFDRLADRVGATAGRGG